MQGADVPGSDYAFAGRSNAHALALSVCVLPDIAVCKLMEPSVARHTSVLVQDQACSHYSGVRQRFGAAAAFRIRILSGLANAGREK